MNNHKTKKVQAIKADLLSSYIPPEYQKNIMSDGIHDENRGVDSEMPPEGCQHYADFCEMPWDIQKFVSIPFVHYLQMSLIGLDTTTNVTVYSRNMMKAYG